METNQPLVSVIITTYGRIDFLREAIESVINQTYKNIELIIVDDNANNQNLRNQVLDILKDYPSAKVILNKKNLGGSLARNEGIKAAHGEYISFLDDDDTYEPIRIEEDIKIVKEHPKENIGIIYGYCYMINDKDKIIGEYRNDVSNNPLYQQMMGTICATSQFFIPRYVFDIVGMFEDATCKQDSIMLVKILGEGYKPYCIPKFLTNYRIHSKFRISGHNYKKRISGILLLREWCRKYYSLLNKEQIRRVELYNSVERLKNYIYSEDKENICLFRCKPPTCFGHIPPLWIWRYRWCGKVNNYFLKLSPFNSKRYEVLTILSMMESAIVLFLARTSYHSAIGS